MLLTNLKTTAFVLVMAGVLGIRWRDGPSVRRLCEKGATISVCANVEVSRSNERVAHREVVIAADPGNPARLLAGSIIERQQDGMHADSVTVYASSDGGATWEPVLEKRTEKAGPRYFDPAVAFGPGGSAYFASNGVQGTKRFIDIVRSRDGGKAWTDPTRVENYDDRPFLVVDCTRGKFRDRLYCVCSLASSMEGRLGIYVSTDGGKVFDPPRAAPSKGMSLRDAIRASPIGRLVGKLEKG